MSVIYPAKEKIFEILQNSFDGSDVEVAWGKPGSDEAVGMWEAESESEFKVIGRPVALDENFSIKVGMEALAASGRDAQPAEKRAWEIYEQAVDALRADLHLDGLTFWTRPATGKQEYFQTDARQGCRIWLTIAGKARI